MGDDDETKTVGQSRELVTIDKIPLETFLKHLTRETIRGCGPHECRMRET